jgi:hypothetical protein
MRQEVWRQSDTENLFESPTSVRAFLLQKFFKFDDFSLSEGLTDFGPKACSVPRNGSKAAHKKIIYFRCLSYKTSQARSLVADRMPSSLESKKKNLFFASQAALRNS